MGDNCHYEGGEGVRQSACIGVASPWQAEICSGGVLDPEKDDQYV